MLLALDEDWEVWTAWYEDRLYGATRPLIEELELARVLIPNEDWDKGAKHVNGLIAELEADFRATPPPQRPAIIQAAYREDDRLHLDPPPPPSARDAPQANRQRDAWAAHDEQLAGLEILDPGRTSPAFGRALKCYCDALGENFDSLNIIALGVHGARLDAFAARADDLFLEDAASEFVALAAAHGLFIGQFPEWLAYVDDTSGDPTAAMVEAAANVVGSIKDAPELIGEDVENAATLIAEAAAPPLAADLAARPPVIVQRELLRSVGYIASALFQPLVAYAREIGSALKEESLEGAK